METTLVIAGWMVYMSVLCLFWFPGGISNVVKTDGGWLFIHADITTLSISVAVLLLRMTVGPTFWKKVEERAKKAMGVALVSMAIAARHVFLTVVGNNSSLRFSVNWSFIVFAVFTSVSIIILRSR